MKRSLQFLLILIWLTTGFSPAAPAQARKMLATPAATLSLVKDINNDPSDTSLAGFAQIGNTLFIVANDNVHGYELWKSNGSPSGTVLVKDIQSGANSGFPYNLGVAHNRVFFQADDGTHGTELWVSDGTEAGTQMVADNNPGNGSNNFYSFASLGTDLLFASSDAGSALPDVGNELFKSSSPFNNMSLVKDINTENDGVDSGNPQYLTYVNGVVFFRAYGPDGAATAFDLGEELWKTNGTPGGTVFVKDINPTQGTSSNLHSLMEANNLLFFQAEDGIHGTELWKSDGSANGTQLVLDIFPGDDGGAPATPNNSNASPMIEYHDRLYFIADDGTNGVELWKTDGTNTSLVKNIRAGSASAFPNTDSTCFKIVNDQLFFLARDDAHGLELWKTDGTEAGTTLFLDINPSGDSTACNFVENNGIYYFIANDGDGQELWQTDGTVANTFSLTNMNAAGGTIFSLHLLNGNLYFFWDDGVHGAELWQAIPPQVTTTTITADVPDPSSPNQTVAVAVTVTGTLATPTGTVDITGADTNCQITLAGGSGSCNVVFTASGKKTLKATYTGDATSLSSKDVEIHQVITTTVFTSLASQDGWILESGENTNAGGTMHNASTTLRLGDDAARKQYRSILSFNTQSLPDNAVIDKVTLKVKRQGIVGSGNPVSAFQGFMADIRKGFFSNVPNLQLADWNATASKTMGPFSPVIGSGWYSLNLTTAKLQINKLSSNGGLTQIRLRFKLDDNNNAIANYLSLYSGNAGVANQPQLIVEYHVP